MFFPIVGILLITASGFFEAIMDITQFHYHKSIFSEMNPIFWNPEISWKNKYLSQEPSLGPKFIGSTSLFVGITDGWHLSKLIRTFLLFLGFFMLILANLSLFNSILSIIISRTAFGLMFTAAFNKILRK